MKLASDASVKEALTIGDGLDIIDASLVMASHTATQDLAAAILHEFDAGNFVDSFQIYSTKQVGSMYRATLALRRGFLSGAPTAVWASSYALLSEGEALDATEFRWDAELGSFVVESAVDYTGRYVRVSYAAGFDADGDDTELYDQTQVPEWLRRSASMLAASVAVTLNPDLAGDQSGAKRDAKMLKDTAMRIAMGHLRYFPSPIRPV